MVGNETYLGPKPMMVSVARFAKKAGVECEVSLENKMACGVRCV